MNSIYLVSFYIKDDIRVIQFNDELTYVSYVSTLFDQDNLYTKQDCDCFFKTISDKDCIAIFRSFTDSNELKNWCVQQVLKYNCLTCLCPVDEKIKLYCNNADKLKQYFKEVIFCDHTKWKVNLPLKDLSDKEFILLTNILSYERTGKVPFDFAIFNENFTIPDIDKSRYSKIDSDNALIFFNNKTVNFQFVIKEFNKLSSLGDLA